MWDLVGYGAIVLFLLLYKEKSPTGTVDIGVPTVSGSGSQNFNGQDYATNQPNLMA